MRLPHTSREGGWFKRMGNKQKHPGGVGVGAGAGEPGPGGSAWSGFCSARSTGTEVRREMGQQS